MIKEDLKQFFEEHQQYMKPEIYSTAEKHDETTIISNITKRFSSVRSHEVPRISIECDDWKSKPGKNTRGITVSMINRDLQKISLPVYFDELKKKDRLTLTADLDRVSKEYGFGPSFDQLLYNAASYIGATMGFKGFSDYPFFEVYTGCASHTIELFIKDLTRDIVHNLKEVPEHTLSDLLQELEKDEKHNASFTVNDSFMLFLPLLILLPWLAPNETDPQIKDGLFFEIKKILLRGKLPFLCY